MEKEELITFSSFPISMIDLDMIERSIGIRETIEISLPITVLANGHSGVPMEEMPIRKR